MTLRVLPLLVLLLGMESGHAATSDCEDLARQIRSAAAGTVRPDASEAAHPECLRTGSYAVELGLRYVEAKKYPDAIRIAKDAIATAGSRRPNLFHVIAIAQAAAGEKAKAQATAEQLMREYPHYVPILGTLITQSFESGDWNAALRYSKRAFEEGHGAGPAIGMQVAYLKLEQYADSVYWYRQALEIDPSRLKNKGAAANALLALIRLHKETEARELAVRHMAVDPDWRSDPGLAEMIPLLLETH